MEIMLAFSLLRHDGTTNPETVHGCKPTFFSALPGKNFLPCPDYRTAAHFVTRFEGFWVSAVVQLKARVFLGRDTVSMGYRSPTFLRNGYLHLIERQYRHQKLGH